MKYDVFNFYLLFFTVALSSLSADSENTQQAIGSESSKTTSEEKSLDKANQKTADKTEKTDKAEKTDKTEKSDKTSDKTGSATESAANSDITLKLGILSFPTSQQIVPLVAFGQNLLDKKQFQSIQAVSKYKGHDEYFITATPTLIYAFTDTFTIFLANPIAVRNQEREYHSSGGGDAIIQFEYAFYNKAYRTFYDQATIVVNATIPTGSIKKTPMTGIGSNSFFIGGTFSRNGINWIKFISSGGVFTASSHKTKFGDQLLYECGIGRRIMNTKEWLFAWLIELDGIYSTKDKINGKRDNNSGGNIIYLTPSLWLSSSESLIFQIGMGFPIQQHLFGHQPRKDYLAQTNLGWTF